MDEPLPLSLPEEFLLLSHLDTGKVSHEHATSHGCAAAELGELLIRDKIGIWHHERRFFGLTVQLGSGKIDVRDSGSTGLRWAEDVLNALVRQQAARSKPVSVPSWVRRRSSEALHRHRSGLIARGLMLHAPTSRWKPDRYFPHRPAREALLAELHAAITGRRPHDGRTYVLSELATANGLGEELRGGLSAWSVFKARREGIFNPSFVQATSALTSAIPRPSGGGDGGGDGDGGE
ncbi:GPP34 family phosphoprotein [Saccharopolyspora sp. NPDC000359]|uniref:GOLPH3/VPS74 family protein n=1 Tax=Saccharopolyspora sp. NPDC000359 TaxID=3154251 RepID=UPI00331BA61A